MSALKVIVFLGTVRENRVGIRVTNFILNHLKETNHDVELFALFDVKYLKDERRLMIDYLKYRCGIDILEIKDRNHFDKYSEMGGFKYIIFCSDVPGDGKLSSRIAKFVAGVLMKNSHTVSVFDPLEMQFPVIQQPVHFYKDKSKAPKWLLDAEQKIKDADAYILVSGEYNCTIPPALTNMMDHFPPSAYAHKPSGIITYSPGMYGGIRSGLAIRPFLHELGSVTVPAIITIPKVNQALDENGKPSSEQEERLTRQAKRLIEQVDWYAEALKRQREVKGVPQ